MLPVNEKSLPGREYGLVGEWFSLHERLGQRIVEIFDPRLPNGDFGIDDRVNH
jgi:hypothetical protein